MKMMRKIVRIDEEKCNGCGECVPSCAEGAIRLINGKAKLVAENLCDGLGACLGKCPMDAITVEERAADGFDESAVEKHLHKSAVPAVPPKSLVAGWTMAAGKGHGGGCPGTRARMLRPVSLNPVEEKHVEGKLQESRLRQWPVQLALVPTKGAMWEGADVLIAADCVSFAYPEFHERMLAGKSLAIACPKLDNVEPYVQKLAMIFSQNWIKSITVVRMEVPCCGGIVRAVQMGMKLAGREDIPMEVITVGIEGNL